MPINSSFDENGVVPSPNPPAPPDNACAARTGTLVEGYRLKEKTAVMDGSTAFYDAWYMQCVPQN